MGLEELALDLWADRVSVGWSCRGSSDHGECDQGELGGKHVERLVSDTPHVRICISTMVTGIRIVYDIMVPNVTLGNLPKSLPNPAYVMVMVPMMPLDVNSTQLRVVMESTKTEPEGRQDNSGQGQSRGQDNVRPMLGQ